MKRWGMHHRLLFAAFVLIAATTFALGYVGIHIAQQFLQERFEARIAFLARYLALNSELGILIDDRAMLQRLAENLLSEKDVLAVAILDGGGRPLATVQKEEKQASAVVESPVSLKVEEESTAFDLGSEAEPAPIGRVRITYSTESIALLMKRMRARFIWLSAGLAVAAAVIFFFISRSLVGPVSRLAQAARQVAGGDLTLRAPPSGIRETQELSEAFNVMLDSLERNRIALQAANEKITRQRTLAEMGKFSLMVAHEVKNPLSIIKSSLDLLKKDPSFNCNDTLVYYMEDEIRRLNRLIEDFLAFARPAKPTFRRVDLNRIVEELVTRYSLESPVQIHAEIQAEPCFADADPDLLSRAIGNVIRNALEANGEGGIVEVSAAWKEDLWRATVADQGEGIEEEHLKRIFEPFFTTRSKGSGLGLAYADQVVRSHGGSITARNRPEGGACFEIQLPVRASAGES